MRQSGGGPLDALDEVGEEADAVGGAKEAAGGKKDAVAGKGDAVDGGKETLRLKIELNLDVELQLKATIKGDIVIGLLN